jgi:hypothetical protein
MIKPEFFGDVVLSEVSRDARLLYAGLWQLMDRRGLMEYHPKVVKRDVFPHDEDIGAADVEAWLWSLVRIGRVRVLDFDGKRYLHCPHLPKHQHFHQNEKPNALLSDDIATKGVEVRPPPVPKPPQDGPFRPTSHRRSTVPAPEQHGANPADTDTEADADSEAEADPDPVRLVCDRLGLHPNWREYWRPRVPDKTWLVDRLLLFELEKDAPGNAFAGRPLVQRASDFVRRGLEKRAREVARSGPGKSWQDVYAEMTGERPEAANG